MKSNNIDAYVIPSEDQHMSEYLPECYQRRKWISGFTGSAGTGNVFSSFFIIAVVTQKEALLWTDSRYFLQASKQLPSFWTLMKIGTVNCPTINVSSCYHHNLLFRNGYALILKKRVE